MKSPVVLTGVLLTTACAILYVFEPPLLKAFSQNLYDTLMRLRAEPPKADAVVIVDIDEASLARHGQWPWPRHQVARLTQKIIDAGASAVALDIVFAEADRTSPAAVQRDVAENFNATLAWSGLPGELADFDQYFAGVLSSGPTILGAYLHTVKAPVSVDESADPNYRGIFFTRGVGSAVSNLMQADSVVMSIPVLSRAARNNAFFNTTPDADNVVRSTPLACAYGPTRIYPSVALEAVRIHRGETQAGLFADEDGVTHVQIGDAAIPTDPHGRLLINYRTLQKAPDGHFYSFPSLSAESVMQGSFDPSALRGKIVFIGTSAAGLRDLRATPMTVGIPGADFSGVEILATMADNMLVGDCLRLPKWLPLFDVLAIVIAGLLTTLAVARTRALVSFAIALVPLAACSLACSYALMRYANIVFTPGRVFLSIALVYSVLTVLRYWQQERQVRWIRKAFGAMVSDKVLTYLEDNPESITRAGRKTEASILFADIVAFSGIAESIEPERLTELMNSFLSPMTEIIMQRDGYVDKYVGDLIMAEWGVPYAVPDHALQACRAALEQIAALEKLNLDWKERFGHTIAVRIGINTGVVTAGNMGSRRRFQFTVMGDAVNLAARLEPLNKEYGTTILIGERTAELVKDVLNVRLVDRVTLHGRTTQENVYELIGEKSAG